MSEIVFDQSNHRFVVSGELTFATVKQLNEQGERLMARDNELVFDFSQVSRSNSAGLVLLTSWLRAAKQQHKSICFINLPQQLLAIAHACRLEHVLPLVVQ